jgi:hypothetical protein
MWQKADHRQQRKPRQQQNQAEMDSKPSVGSRQPQRQHQENQGLLALHPLRSRNKSRLNQAIWATWAGLAK